MDIRCGRGTVSSVQNFVIIPINPVTDDSEVTCLLTVGHEDCRLGVRLKARKMQPQTFCCCINAIYVCVWGWGGGGCAVGEDVCGVRECVGCVGVCGVCVCVFFF